MRISKNFFILFILFLLAFTPCFALAQESGENDSANSVETAAGEAQIDEEVTAEDLGVSEPLILPDSPFYGLKNLWRGVSLTFTFNKVKKAEKRLQHANERVIEAQEIAEEKGDEKSLARLEKVMDKYEKDLAKVRETVDKIDEKIDENPKLEQFVNKFTNSEINRRKVLQNLEANENIPEKVLEKIIQAKEKAAEGFGKVLQKAVPEEKIAEKIEEILKKQKGSDLKDLKQLQIIKEIKEHVPEKIKEKLGEVEQNRLEAVEQKLRQVSDVEKENFFEYLRETKGDAVNQLEVLNDLKTRVNISSSLAGEISKIENRKIEHFEERLKNFQDKDLRARVLNNLSGDDSDVPATVKQRLQSREEIKEHLKKLEENKMEKIEQEQLKERRTIQEKQGEQSGQDSGEAKKLLPLLKEKLLKEPLPAQEQKREQVNAPSSQAKPQGQQPMLRQELRGEVNAPEQ